MIDRKVVVPMHEAKSSLSQLVKRAAAGETIYIGAYGRAEAKLVAASDERTPDEVRAARERFLGSMAGQIQYTEGWDAPMTAEELEWFAGRPLSPGEPPK
jgi:antitoxin (DNA-binding transcriptional repressor) of toxin-antitoxin stability system